MLSVLFKHTERYFKGRPSVANRYQGVPRGIFASQLFQWGAPLLENKNGGGGQVYQPVLHILISFGGIRQHWEGSSIFTARCYAERS